jgi:mannose-6-phosphate isomerase-like protein (cupin superfamily)
MQPKYSVDLHHIMNSGELKIIKWAKSGLYDPDEETQTLIVPTVARPMKLAHSHATGEALASNGLLGADIIRLSAGDGFVPHVHPGDHLLIVIGGLGTVSYGGKIYPTQAGEIYMIDGNVPHAVGAITDHVILAVGSPHRPVDSPDRMTPVEYEAVTAYISDLHCLICDIKASLPDRLHDRECPHCPCEACHPPD